MDTARIDELIAVYRDGLLQDVEPFWTCHSIDRERGGYLTCLDRYGEVFSTDKHIWMNARMVWFYARLYNQVERKPEWLELSRQGAEFLVRHCFDEAGRMYPVVTRQGEPLGEAGNPYGMCFALMGLAELALATGEEWARAKAIATYDLFLSDLRAEESPGAADPATRVHGKRMILLAMTPTIEQVDDRPVYQEALDRCIEEVFDWFCKPDLQVVMEQVGLNGEILEGRQTICPGHALETAWFIIDEARRRGDLELARRALPLVEWNLEKGWDPEHGGLFLITDLSGNPSSHGNGSMKFWWPHVEALCAALVAYAVTGDPKWESWFERLHEYSFQRFPDPEYGEWYGYLQRDGTPAAPFAYVRGDEKPATAVKGDLNKSAFHLMRTQMACWRLLQALREGRGMEGKGEAVR